MPFYHYTHIVYIWVVYCCSANFWFYIYRPYLDHNTNAIRDYQLCMLRATHIYEHLTLKQPATMLSNMISLYLRVAFWIIIHDSQIQSVAGENPIRWFYYDLNPHKPPGDTNISSFYAARGCFVFSRPPLLSSPKTLLSTNHPKTQSALLFMRVTLRVSLRASLSVRFQIICIYWCDSFSTMCTQLRQRRRRRKIARKTHERTYTRGHQHLLHTKSNSIMLWWATRENGRIGWMDGRKYLCWKTPKITKN